MQKKSESMEEYLYTFYNKKSFDKKQIIELVSSLVSSINKYKNDDIKVKIFAFILKLECEENLFDYY